MRVRYAELSTWGLGCAAAAALLPCRSPVAMPAMCWPKLHKLTTCSTCPSGTPLISINCCNAKGRGAVRRCIHCPWAVHKAQRGRVYPLALRGTTKATTLAQLGEIGWGTRPTKSPLPQKAANIGKRGKVGSAPHLQAADVALHRRREPELDLLQACRAEGAGHASTQARRTLQKALPRLCGKVGLGCKGSGLQPQPQPQRELNKRARPHSPPPPLLATPTPLPDPPARGTAQAPPESAPAS